MKYSKQRNRVAVFLMGALIVLSFVLLSAAESTRQVGRYRMNVVTRGNFTDIYIIDTVTGVVKYAGKDEGKPFEAISGR